MRVVVGEDFSGFEAAALWDDTKLGLKHLGGWERMAVVSDVEWIRAAIKIFGLAIPGHVRVFHDRELGEARRWISESRTSTGHGDVPGSSPDVPG